MQSQKLNANEIKNWFEYNPDTGQMYARRPIIQRGNQIGWSEYRRVGCVHKASGYIALRMGRGTNLRASRVAWLLMTGEDPGNIMIDHIDGDTGNDRWGNLRLATTQQNGFNRSNTKGRKLPKGVYYDEGKPKPYRARIWVNNKGIGLGSYSTLEEASAARKAGELKHFGDYARQHSAL